MHVTDEIREALTLYVFGLLDSDAVQTLDEHLREGCFVCSDELRILHETSAALPAALEEIKPHPRVKDRLLHRISKGPRIEEPAPGIFVIRNDTAGWRKTPYKGVWTRTLYVDRQTDYVTSLLKLDAGAAYPAHRHRGVEQCLVIEGSCRIGPISISAGDFEWANADTEHSEVISDQGCVLLILASKHDEVFSTE